MEWKFVAHISETNQHILQQKTNYEGLDLRREIVTRYNQGGTKPGKSKTFYYIKDVPGEFKTIDECIENCRRKHGTV